ncbi:hypothetical protein DO97_13710 [Neosynechococcus sphagnicola sy1]|uniref:Right handed beta helix domain-containing protein n=1 Tax=Neosynechococcus sphagnicola sy1 TaxID=1497020 RepID=A0A098THA4_9CYAN|nr:right-handed parallel beta-helix repeat-containing protein [Neosynechococcus sphagnicola]KGF71965.1 hypothetical protein DO97_13710 [Neosynechococcus sphagnicola sy1]
MSSPATPTVQPITPELPPPPPPQPTTLVVAPDSPYPTLGAAISAAVPGSTIQVQPGTYRESLVVDKPLLIEGIGAAEQVVIQAENGPCLRIQTDQATVRNLLLLGQSAAHYAVEVHQGELRLERCNIITLKALGNLGVQGACARIAIAECGIYVGEDSAGVVVADNGGGTIENCLISGSPNSQILVEIKTGGDPVIRGCQILHGHHHGVVISQNAGATIESCEIAHNGGAAIAILTGGNPLIRQCRIHHNQGNGILAADEGRGTIEQCDIFGHAQSEVLITTAGSPIFWQCRIHEGQQSCLEVVEAGQGTLDECDLFGSSATAPVVVIESGGDPLIRHCQIRDGHAYGLVVRNQGKGTIDGCHIAGNREGAWTVAPDCQVVGLAT